MKMYGVLCVAVGITMLLTPMAAIEFERPAEEKASDIQTVAEETATGS